MKASRCARAAVMKASFTGPALVVGAAIAAASTASFLGCWGGDTGTAGNIGARGDESTGTLGLRLTLPGGEAIETVAYEIHGPNTYSGSVDVSGSAPTFSFVIPRVAPGSGYRITLTATTADGAVTCAATSSPFDVKGNQTTRVNVLLACTTTIEAGSVLVDGAGFDCATWHTAVANPASTTTGGSVALVGFATGPDPGALTYQWSAPAGTIAGATTASAIFTCPATPGDVTITLAVGDGPVPQGASCPAASSTTSLTVTCETPNDAGAPMKAAAIATGGGSSCALTTTGAVLCWGSNTYGQLGDGSTTDSQVPVAVSSLSHDVRAISAGQSHACAVTSAGGVVCWGRNANGQLGNDSTTASPLPVGGLRVVVGGRGHRGRRQSHLRDHEGGGRPVLGAQGQYKLQRDRQPGPVLRRRFVVGDRGHLGRHLPHLRGHERGVRRVLGAQRRRPARRRLVLRQ